MFNRFTQRALRVLFCARSEVSQLGSSAVEPEHILLGLLDEGSGIGSRILARAGVARDDLRSDIVGRLVGREKVPECEEIPFSASCERALQYAAEEAFTFLVHWFEEILGRQVIDETGLPGVYGFELKERVNTPEALIRVLRDEAGLVITREQREIPTLIVRQRKRNMILGDSSR